MPLPSTQRARRALPLLLALASLVLAPAALAEPPSRDAREYQRSIASALQEFNAGNFPEARALFTRAHELSPNARTNRGLGFVAFELRNYAESIGYLEAALHSQEKPLEGETRRSTEELLTRARGMVARIGVRVLPKHASVQVDGLPVAPSSDGVLVLQVGDHVLEVQASGHVTQRRALKIAGGEQLNLSIELARLEIADRPAQTEPGASAAATSATRSESDVTPERRWYRSPWLWTAVALVVVGGGVGTYFLLRDDGPRTRERSPTTTGNTPPDGVIKALGRF